METLIKKKYICVSTSVNNNELFYILDDWFKNKNCMVFCRTEEDFYGILNNTKGLYSDYVFLTNDRKSASRFFISNNIITTEGKDKENLIKEIEWTLGMNRTENKTEEDKIFFISDTHFHHKNIIRYCNRPWYSNVDSEGKPEPTDEDVLKMNVDLIENWNSTVDKDDTVYFLGDFVFGKNKMESMTDILKKLNGNISIVLGNHDTLPIQSYYDAGFKKVYDKPVIIRDFIILSHKPVQWIKNGDVYFNCFGHVHNQEMYKRYTKNTFNCSVEVNDYKPVSLKTIMELTENR